MIREATASDISSLVTGMNRLVDHVVRTTNDVYMTNIDKADYDNLAAICSNALKNEDARIFVNEKDGNCTGFIYGRISQPFVPVSTIKRVGLVEMCWVEEICRKQGIARKLTERLESWFKQKRIDYAELNFLVGNAEAELSWQKLGYRPFRVAARKRL